MIERKNKSMFIKLGVMLVSFTLALVLLFNIDNISGCFVKYDTSVRVNYDNGEKIYYIDGVAYTHKAGIETTLIIGIDAEGEMKGSETYNNNDQADFLLLAVIDRPNEKCCFLQINRDTMTEINILGVDGNVVQTQRAQIALAHTYGDGMEKSCENTVDAVSELLYGIEINHYMAFTMSAISILNDHIGGVYVNVEDDLTPVDASLKKGTSVKLNGKQAMSFIRSRTGLSDSTNLNRMARQKQYVESFVKTLKQKKITNRFISDAYYKVEQYTLFDGDFNQISNTLSSIVTYNNKGVIVPKGDSVKGKDFMEFNVDEDNLKKIVIDLFLQKAEG